jgi:hypothetical protein
MKIDKRTKAATEIANASEPEAVWNHADFERELERAKKIGPRKMDPFDLLGFCHRMNSYLHAHFWTDARPFFVELWRRIEAGEFRVTKTEACQRIGCTRQWANAIVSGRADEERGVRAKAKMAKTGKSLSAETTGTTILGEEDYVDEILKHAFAKLEPLRRTHWDRYSRICEELAEQFETASKTPPTGEASGGRVN